jgi:hypothetical protein
MNTIIQRRNRMLATMPQIDPSKLSDYKYVTQVKVGCYVRWVPRNDLTQLVRGGFVISVDHNRVLCRNVSNHFFAFHLQKVHVFQKIEPQEYIMLIASDSM